MTDDLPAPTMPILKWVGGKSRLLPDLRARLPRIQFKRYFEPFAGGAALFFDQRPRDAVLSDGNVDLINVYRMLAADVDHVLELLEAHQRGHKRSRKIYYECQRQIWNGGAGRTIRNIERAARFMYLNKACFNGLWRVNKAGRFNVPPGDGPVTWAEANLRAAAQILRGAVLRSSDFRVAAQDARPGDFVYFDPPYDPASKTASFTSYTAAGFGPADQRDLAAIVQGMARRGVAVMVSNSDTAFVRRLYAGLTIAAIRAPRAVSGQAGKRPSAAELIITAQCR